MTKGTKKEEKYKQEPQKRTKLGLRKRREKQNFKSTIL
jgi:hypothetical protein